MLFADPHPGGNGMVRTTARFHMHRCVWRGAARCDAARCDAALKGTFAQQSNGLVTGLGRWRWRLVVLEGSLSSRSSGWWLHCLVTVTRTLRRRVADAHAVAASPRASRHSGGYSTYSDGTCGAREPSGLPRSARPRQRRGWGTGPCTELLRARRMRQAMLPGVGHGVPVRPARDEVEHAEMQ